MQTRAQKKRRDHLKKKIIFAVKTIFAVLLLLLGIVYWYNGNGNISDDEGKEYSTGAQKEKKVTDISELNNNTTTFSEKTDTRAENPDTKTEKTDIKTEKNDTKSDNPDTKADNQKTGVKEDNVLTGEENNIQGEQEQLYDSEGRLNINIAEKQDLVKLNGIGEKRAQDIIDYRTLNGRFKNIEEIMKVKGIKQGIFSKIKEYIFC